MRVSERECETEARQRREGGGGELSQGRAVGREGTGG